MYQNQKDSVTHKPTLSPNPIAYSDRDSIRKRRRLWALLQNELKKERWKTTR